MLIGKYFYSFTDLDLKLYLFRYNIETILYIYFDEEKKSFAVKKFIHPNIEKSRKIEYFYNAIFNNDDNNYNLEDINYNLFITYLYLNNTKNINIKSIFEYTLVNYNNIFYNDNYIKILYLLFINYINDISFGSNDFDIKKTKEILKQKSINQDFLQNLYDFFLKNVNEKIDNGELNKMNLSSVKFIIRLYFEFNYLFYLMFDKKLQNFSELLFSIQKIIDNLGNNNKIIGLNRFIIYNFIIYKNEKINIFRELQKFIFKNSDNFYKKGENFLNNETNFYDFLIKNFLDDKKDNIEKLDDLVSGFDNKLLNEGEINNLNRKKKTLKNFIKIFNI